VQSEHLPVSQLQVLLIPAQVLEHAAQLMLTANGGLAETKTLFLRRLVQLCLRPEYQ